MTTYCSKLPSDGATWKCPSRIYEPRSMGYLCCLNGECDLQTEDITESNPIAKGELKIPELKVPNEDEFRFTQEDWNQVKVDLKIQDDEFKLIEDHFKKQTIIKSLREEFQDDPLRASVSILALTTSISLVIGLVVIIISLCLTNLT